MDFEKIKQCIDIANEYRKEIAIELIDAMKVPTLTSMLMAFFDSWKIDREWSLKANKALKFIRPIALVTWTLISVPYIVISYPFKKSRLRKKIQNIKAQTKLDYCLNDCFDFVQLWDQKGLPKSNYDNQNLGFYESTIIECILKWYEILKGNSEAKIIEKSLTRERQEFMRETFKVGIHVSMEPISSVLLKEINFVL